LTDLNYTLAVKEAETGNTKSYNDTKIGTTVCGKFDTSGFLSTSELTPTSTPQGPTATPTPAPTGTPTPTPTKGASVVQVVYAGVNSVNSFMDAVSLNSFTTIHVGDSVKWMFPSPDFHSTTSGVCTPGGGYYDDGSCTPDGNWDSGQMYRGQNFTRQFLTAGTYRYFCQVHLSMMTGTIQVDP
jgi:plastocyanin